MCFNKFPVLPLEEAECMKNTRQIIKIVIASQCGRGKRSLLLHAGLILIPSGVVFVMILGSGHSKRKGSH